MSWSITVKVIDNLAVVVNATSVIPDGDYYFSGHESPVGISMGSSVFLLKPPAEDAPEE